MITYVHVKNFGPIADMVWEKPGRINLLLGSNASGKTFLLKGLYTAIKVMEAYGRGNSKGDVASLLADRLYWTYQGEKIGDIVSRKATGPLEFKICVDDQTFSYSFGSDTEKKILFSNNLKNRKHNSIFFPAKEILSLQHIIKLMHEEYKFFGFDLTYVDLAQALDRPPSMGKNFHAFSTARKDLDQKIIHGKVEYDTKKGVWIYKQGNTRFPIGLTSEGVKKLAILDTLLGNRYLDPNSIIFIDEPESGLHPAALVMYLDIIAKLASAGIQFFLASHSYSVLKKLYIIARKTNLHISLMSWEEDPRTGVFHWLESNLSEDVPTNSLVKESIKLYEEEMDIELGA